MKPGRNDPCPCGGGKKYKKCCLGKKAQALAAAQKSIESQVPIEPRFFSPVNSFYTQGALMEALKPGGMVYIHPYVLHKLRDDPRLLADADPVDREQLVRSWRPSKV